MCWLGCALIFCLYIRCHVCVGVCAAGCRGFKEHLGESSVGSHLHQFLMYGCLLAGPSSPVKEEGKGRKEVSILETYSSCRFSVRDVCCFNLEGGGCLYRSLKSSRSPHTHLHGSFLPAAAAPDSCRRCPPPRRAIHSKPRSPSRRAAALCGPPSPPTLLHAPGCGGRPRETGRRWGRRRGSR